MNQQTIQVEPIYSTLGGDPDLGEIVELFVNEMPDRITSLVAQMDTKDWEALRRTAHQLKGSAGSYGFAQITPSAAKLETSLGQCEPEDQIRAALDELLDLCTRIRTRKPG